MRPRRQTGLHAAGKCLTAALAIAALCGTGCAARQTPEKPALSAEEAAGDEANDDGRMRFDPVEVFPGPDDEIALSELNPDELAAMGKAAFAAGDFEKSAKAWGRLADVWPDLPEAPNASFQAGLALERLSRHEDAGNRFAAVANAASGQGTALQAAFHLAAALYHLEDYERAERLLRTITERRDLERDEILMAAVQHAVCLVELGRLDEAEHGFQRALNFWRAHKNEEDFDLYLPAQAQFFLGEIGRIRFEDMSLDASQDEAALANALERKCRLLLDAQEHYLTAIRMNHPHWSTSAGYRVGALYERLYDDMLAAKPPEGLSEEEAAVYRQELLARIRILVTKALPIYEQTLAAAERTGTTSPFVDKARAGLERLRTILTSDDGDAAPDSGGRDLPEKPDKTDAPASSESEANPTDDSRAEPLPAASSAPATEVQI